jgi:hypothetical protein
MELGNFKRDSAAITAGQWVSDIPDGGDIRVRVRGLSSPVAIDARARKERNAPKKSRSRDGSLKAEPGIQIMREVLSEVILLEIEGLTEGGKPVDLARAKAMILDPDYEALADIVAWAARAVERGVADDAEAAEKN